jgi:hypothetical protein
MDEARMIKRVIFGTNVAVVQNNPRVMWEVGRDGVEEIVADGGRLQFALAGGARRMVYPPPGTILDEVADPPAAKETDGRKSSQDSAQPPPARPIPARGRVQR